MGAEVSLLPATRTDRLCISQGTKQTATNGSHICTLDTFNVTVIQRTALSFVPSLLLKSPSHYWGHTFSGPTQSWLMSRVNSWFNLYHFILHYCNSTSSTLHCLGRWWVCYAAGRPPRHHYTLFSLPYFQTKCECLHYCERTTFSCSCAMTSPRPAANSQERVYENWEDKHHLPFKQSVGCRPPPGAQISMGLEAMWRFPPFEFCNNTSLLPRATYAEFLMLI